MSTYDLTDTDLAHFHGTEQWYRHGVVKSVLYTEGAQYVAEHGGAYWLLDEIAFAQVTRPVIAGEPFQVWELVVEPSQRARLVISDGNDRILGRTRIPWTDFPLSRLTLWCVDKVIMLPSEY
jgi:hypothetical protein